MITEYKVGNVILFKANLESAEQAKNLCRDIKALVLAETGCEAFIAIDQEGGAVVRLPDDMVNVPGAMALAASGKTQNIDTAVKITAAELGRIGVNLNLAPVLDINCARDNPAIGNRSFSPDAQEVADLGLAAIKAYGETGLMCCAKHFPGHGDTTVDSHLDLPLVDKSRSELEKRELVPFKAAVRAGIPAIMTTHILFPQIESGKLPATMSAKILKGLLRKELGFNGLILSDGMEMNAVKTYYGVGQGCVLALGAGVDIVFVCHESPDMEKSLKEAYSAYEKGYFDKTEFDESVERILACKERYAGFGKDEKPLPAESLETRKKQNGLLMQDTISSNVQAGGEGASFSLGKKPFFAGCLAYRSTIASASPDDQLSFGRWFASRFEGGYMGTPVNPTPDEIENIVKSMPESTSIVFGSYNGHLNRGQMQLAAAFFDMAKQKGIPFACLALRNPWDISLLPQGAYGLALWEYTEKSFEAAAAVFRGESAPCGILPRL
jgi:beta-N-acetylhexosaminidase